jgi:hypothetical protein
MPFISVPHVPQPRASTRRRVRTHTTRRVVVKQSCAYTHARTLTRDDDDTCAHTRRVVVDSMRAYTHARQRRRARTHLQHTHTQTTMRTHAPALWPDATHTHRTQQRATRACTNTQGEMTQGETTHARGDDACRGRRSMQGETLCAGDDDDAFDDAAAAVPILILVYLY